MMFDSTLEKVDMLEAIPILMKDLGFSKGVTWYIKKRLSNEGVPFLTVSLPALSKHVLKCIEADEWTPFDYSGLSPFSSRGCERYTYFLYDELFSIFTKNSDSALNLWRVRQLCEYAYKLALPFADSMLEEAARKFLATDLSITYCPKFADQMRKLAESTLVKTRGLRVDDVLKNARTGPGTFSGYSGSSGISLQTQKDNLDGIVPYGLRAFSGAFRSRQTSLANGAPLRRSIAMPAPRPKRVWSSLHKKQIDVRDPRPFQASCLRRKRKPLTIVPDSFFNSYSEVLFVPKDSRGPRTIVRESPHHLLLQMGLHDSIKPLLEADTDGRIQFINQEEFRDLARQSSIDKRYATLDLAEASDSVSFGLAATVFQNFPAIRCLFQKARSSEAKMPDGSIVPLRKLSGMGSGFTFPVMASLIYIAILASVPKHLQCEIKSEIFVYGDDIIIPTNIVRYALKGLSLAGFTVNTNKSYWKSNFRESCGGDYYNGQCVTPVRFKQSFCKLATRGTKVLVQKRSASMFLLKLERHCRELVKSGLLRLADYYYDLIERTYGHNLPVGSGDTPILCRYSIVDQFVDPQWVRALVPKVVHDKVTIQGYDRSFKNKLATMTEDCLGILDSVPFGLNAQRYNVVLEEHWVPDLVLRITA